MEEFVAICRMAIEHLESLFSRDKETEEKNRKQGDEEDAADIATDKAGSLDGNGSSGNTYGDGNGSDGGSQPISEGDNDDTKF